MSTRPATRLSARTTEPVSEPKENIPPPTAPPNPPTSVTSTNPAPPASESPPPSTLKPSISLLSLFNSAELTPKKKKKSSRKRPSREKILKTTEHGDEKQDEGGGGEDDDYDDDASPEEQVRRQSGIKGRKQGKKSQTHSSPRVNESSPLLQKRILPNAPISPFRNYLDQNNLPCLDTIGGPEDAAMLQRFFASPRILSPMAHTGNTPPLIPIPSFDHRSTLHNFLHLPTIDSAKTQQQQQQQPMMDTLPSPPPLPLLPLPDFFGPCNSNGVSVQAVMEMNRQMKAQLETQNALIAAMVSSGFTLPAEQTMPWKNQPVRALFSPPHGPRMDGASLLSPGAEAMLDEIDRTMAGNDSFLSSLTPTALLQQQQLQQLQQQQQQHGNVVPPLHLPGVTLSNCMPTSLVRRTRSPLGSPRRGTVTPVLGDVVVSVGQVPRDAMMMMAAKVGDAIECPSPVEMQQQGRSLLLSPTTTTTIDAARGQHPFSPPPSLPPPQPPLNSPPLSMLFAGAEPVVSPSISFAELPSIKMSLPTPHLLGRNGQGDAAAPPPPPPTTTGVKSPSIPMETQRLMQRIRKRAPLQRSSTPRSPHASSTYRGVTKAKSGYETHVWDPSASNAKKSRARGRQFYISGGFKTETSAARAYDRASIVFLDINAQLNYDWDDYVSELDVLFALKREDAIQWLRRVAASGNDFEPASMVAEVAKERERLFGGGKKQEQQQQVVGENKEEIKPMQTLDDAFDMLLAYHDQMKAKERQEESQLHFT